MMDDSLVALHLPTLDMTRSLGLVWHERRTLSGAAQALMRLMPEAAEV